jgi:hypothetical protein
MPQGAGKAPAGAASAGYGVPDAAYVPNSAILPDVHSGFAQTGRFINPVTGDYRFTPDGRLMGMDTVPQLVLLALMTLRGSSAIPTLGSTFSQVQEKGPSFLAQMRSVVNVALGDLVKKKMVQIDSVATSEPPSNPDAGIVTLLWTDLTTDLQHSNVVGQ